MKDVRIQKLPKIDDMLIPFFKNRIVNNTNSF